MSSRPIKIQNFNRIFDHYCTQINTPYRNHTEKQSGKTWYTFANYSPQNPIMDNFIVSSSTYFVKAHGTEFVYFAFVFRTRDRSASINMRPQPSSLFEHLRILFILKEPKYKIKGKHHRVYHSRFFSLFLLEINSQDVWQTLKHLHTSFQDSFLLHHKDALLAYRSIQYIIKLSLTHTGTWLATTASWGSSGSAAASKACSESKTVRRVIAAALHRVKRYVSVSSSLFFFFWVKSNTAPWNTLRMFSIFDVLSNTGANLEV